MPDQHFPHIAPTARVPPRERLSLVQAAVLATLLLPAVLGVSLFEAFLGTYYELTLQRHRDLLPRATKIIEENACPANLLWGRISKEFGRIRQEITRENARGMAERAQIALQLPADIFCFDASGTLVFPPGRTPEHQERETLYQGFQTYMFRRPLTSEKRELDEAAKRIFKQRFGRVNFLKFFQAMKFEWQSQVPGGPLRHIGYLPIARERYTSMCSGFLIEVDDGLIPLPHLFAHGMRACTEQIGYAAFLGSEGASVVTDRFTPWFPRERLREIPVSREVVALPEGFFLKKPMESRETGYLLVGVPLPFPFNHSQGGRWLWKGFFSPCSGCSHAT